MKNNYLPIVFGIILILISGCVQQPPPSNHLRDHADEFHEIMEEIIDAGRLADSATINRLFPALNARADSILAAEMPQNLIKKQTQITSAATDLKAAVVKFGKYSVAQTAADSIMKALHPMRLAHNRLATQLRVSIPELNAFHAVMHSVWHAAVPNEEWDKVKAVVPQFTEKSAALKNIRWPRELGKRIPALKKKTAELQQIVTELEAANQTDNAAELKSAMIKIHEKYVEIKTLL